MQWRRDGRLELAPGVTVAAAALQWSATASGGPGGQHVNTTMSAVILHLALYAIDGLDGAARVRLQRLAGSRMREDGVLVLRCDSHREQGRNRSAIIDRLAMMVREALIVPKKRRPTKPGRGAIERRLRSKRHTAVRKQNRQDMGDEL